MRSQQVLRRKLSQALQIIRKHSLARINKETKPTQEHHCRLLNYSLGQQGLGCPEDRSIKLYQKFCIGEASFTFILVFPLFHSCMRLQTRLPWNKFTHIGTSNVNSSYMDNISKKIICTSMERRNLRQIIIVVEIIEKTLSVVHFPKKIIQKRSQYPDWFCTYKFSEFSPSFHPFSAFHTIF